MRGALLLGGLVLAGAQNVLAGQVGDNGGDAVVCRDSNYVTSIALLDFYEANALYDRTIESAFVSGDHWDLARHWIERLSRFDTERRDRYLELVAMFRQKLRFQANVVLQDVPDSAHIVVPAGCTIEQLAIQKPGFVESYPRLIINLDLWERLTKRQKAGLILHEVIFADELDRSHMARPAGAEFGRAASGQIAKKVRRFTGYLASVGFGRLSQREFETLLAAPVIEMPGSSDVLVCPGRSLEVFAHYEASVMRGNDLPIPQLDVSTADWKDYLKEKLGPMARLDPERWVRYEMAINNFTTGMKILYGDRFLDISDESYLGLPRGCHREQLMIQRPNKEYFSAPYLVNGLRWGQLDEFQKATAVLHEIIYAELFSKIFSSDGRDSTYARLLTTRLLDVDLVAMDEEVYARMIGESGLSQDNRH